VCRYLRSFYEGSFFRSSKYSVYLAKKASHDRLVDRLRNVFGAGNKAVVVFWGNWGAAPNALRNGPPTPGIGLRRFVHRRLLHDRRRVESVADGGGGPSKAVVEEFRGVTLTTFEGGTSSVCNACGARVENVNGQHRLLRCTNAQCGRHWHRDDMGARNILLQGRTLLQEGRCHPWFDF
jgi:hypothetical protein